MGAFDALMSGGDDENEVYFDDDPFGVGVGALGFGAGAAPPAGRSFSETVTGGSLSMEKLQHIVEPGGTWTGSSGLFSDTSGQETGTEATCGPQGDSLSTAMPASTADASAHGRPGLGAVAHAHSAGTVGPPPAGTSAGLAAIARTQSMKTAGSAGLGVAACSALSSTAGAGPTGSAARGPSASTVDGGSAGLGAPGLAQAGTASAGLDAFAQVQSGNTEGSAGLRAASASTADGAAAAPSASSIESIVMMRAVSSARAPDGVRHEEPEEREDEPLYGRTGEAFLQRVQSLRGGSGASAASRPSSYSSSAPLHGGVDRTPAAASLAEPMDPRLGALPRRGAGFVAADTSGHSGVHTTILADARTASTVSLDEADAPSVPSIAPATDDATPGSEDALQLRFIEQALGRAAVLRAGEQEGRMEDADETRDAPGTEDDATEEGLVAQIEALQMALRSRRRGRRLSGLAAPTLQNTRADESGASSAREALLQDAPVQPPPQSAQETLDYKALYERERQVAAELRGRLAHGTPGASHTQMQGNLGRGGAAATPARRVDPQVFSPTKGRGTPGVYAEDGLRDALEESSGMLAYLRGWQPPAATHRQAAGAPPPPPPPDVLFSCASSVSSSLPPPPVPQPTPRVTPRSPGLGYDRAAYKRSVSGGNTPRKARRCPPPPQHDAASPAPPQRASPGAPPTPAQTLSFAGRMPQSPPHSLGDLLAVQQQLAQRCGGDVTPEEALQVLLSLEGLAVGGGDAPPPPPAPASPKNGAAGGAALATSMRRLRETTRPLADITQRVNAGAPGARSLQAALSKAMQEDREGVGMTLLKGQAQAHASPPAQQPLQTNLRRYSPPRRPSPPPRCGPAPPSPAPPTATATGRSPPAITVTSPSPPLPQTMWLPRLPADPSTSPERDPPPQAPVDGPARRAPPATKAASLLLKLVHEQQTQRSRPPPTHSAPQAPRATFDVAAVAPAGGAVLGHLPVSPGAQRPPLRPHAK